MGIINRIGDLGTFSVETGEVTEITIRNGDRIVRRESVESFRRLSEKYIPLNGKREFVKCFRDIFEPLCKTLSPVEMWVAMAVVPLITTNSGILEYRNGKKVTTAGICGMYREKMSDRSIYRGIAGLVEKGVLAKCRVGGKALLVANPYIYQRGTQVNATLIGLFEDTEWAKWAQESPSISRK